MTRIDFHTKVPDKLAFVCRLLRVASSEGWQAVLACSNEAELSALDSLLWTFSGQDFLPHVRASDPLAAQTPIVLTTNLDEALPHHRLLVNLADRMPPNFARFERLVEVVSADEAELVPGRDRYAFYKQRGYPLKHYDRSINEPVT